MCARELVGSEFVRVEALILSANAEVKEFAVEELERPESSVSA
jgi:hypothetical protein